MPVGVYDYPSSPADAPQITSVQWQENWGPFRIREYGEGFFFFTKVRDILADRSPF